MKPKKKKKNTRTHDDVVEQITNILKYMDGKDLAELASMHFGIQLTYIGDSLYEEGREGPCAT